MQPLWTERDAAIKRDDHGPGGRGPDYGRGSRPGTDRLLLIGTLSGLALMLVGGYVLWVMPFNGDVGPGPGFFGLGLWILAAMWAAAIASWWFADFRTALLLASPPFLLVGLDGLSVTLSGTYGRMNDIAALPVELVLLTSGIAGLAAGYRGLADHPRDRAAAVLVPASIAVALFAGVTGLKWSDGVLLFGAIAAANLAVPWLPALLTYVSSRWRTSPNATGGR
jgi:hypothetical protein